MVIDASAFFFAVLKAQGVPGGTGDIVAAVFFPLDVELGLFVVAQDFSSHKGTDVEAHTVVEVGFQPMGCCPSGFHRTKMS